MDERGAAGEHPVTDERADESADERADGRQGRGAAAAPRTIGSVLVANRGEIACRVFRTCRELGIATVAVHSDADAEALHVQRADAAVRLPGNAAADTYLRGDLLVKAALSAGADAVHPGYGFLSENADFARAVDDAGLIWIGPPPEAIEAMASKTRAKEIMAAAGVPLLASIDPARATDADLPLLVKAAAGGGGRGMRVVRELAELPAELTAARAEAASAFGDGEVFVEPYVERGRHVEVQVLADGHGTVWALGTRDCSLQRRHQKVIEESPAPGLSDELRRTLHEAATEAARTIGYTGAGTVEFLVARDGRAYFLEMNTRLQVEHPVTECVHGVDLVALQLRIAEGTRLDTAPPAPRGHAVEARLYAEDPARDWQPQTGTLHRFEVLGAGGSGGASGSLFGAAPDGTSTGGLRLDTGVADGDVIGVRYDPMLAKAIAWAPTRAEAVRRLAHALDRARIHGPVTNRALLVRSLRHPDFVAARLDTGFYDRNLAGLTGSGTGTGTATPAGREPDSGSGSAPEPDRLASLAALAAALADAAARTAPGAPSLAGRLGGWRNVPSRPQSKSYRSEPDATEYEVRYRLTREGLHAEGHPGVRLLHATPGRVVLEVDGVRRTFDVAAYGDPASGGHRLSGGRLHGEQPLRGDQLYVDSPLGAHAFTALPRFPDPTARTTPGSLLAPMPGTVVRIAEVAVGDAVTAGQPLLWLEAMKMEHRVTAPADGTLTALHAAVGRQVEVGALLAVVATDPEE
ncbi:ATP-binding protein [Streptomyces sp. H27-D2]|uniref:acetyl/propionyl/methylcrotonyl-CoA carboxylase subunit alpha n=1 Tax=Streptomyces sp. H27-D2 TaxID=3046304 RepID=UPI003FA6D497